MSPLLWDPERKPEPRRPLRPLSWVECLLVLVIVMGLVVVLGSCAGSAYRGEVEDRGDGVCYPDGRCVPNEDLPDSLRSFSQWAQWAKTPTEGKS